MLVTRVELWAATTATRVVAVHMGTPPMPIKRAKAKETPLMAAFQAKVEEIILHTELELQQRRRT